MWSISGDDNKGRVFVSIDFDSLMANLDHRCASEEYNKYLDSSGPGLDQTIWTIINENVHGP